MNKNLKPYLLIAPSGIILASIMIVGIYNCIVQSLGYFPQIGMNSITLDYYKEILGEATFLKSLLFSMKTSLISALLSVLIGVIVYGALIMFLKVEEVNVITKMIKKIK